MKGIHVNSCVSDSQPTTKPPARPTKAESSAQQCFALSYHCLASPPS